MEIQPILDKVTTALQGIKGVVSVVLGGSRARGINRPDADIDIGIYYDLTQGFNTEEIGEIASKLDDTRRKDQSSLSYRPSSCLYQRHVSGRGRDLQNFN